MITLEYSIEIDAPRERVWDTMLADETYRQWTALFGAGSHFNGDWSEGSKMHFLAPGPDGQVSGMVSRIKENRLYEYLSIEHLGFIKDGQEDLSCPEVKEWAGALENYTFLQGSGKTTVLIESDMSEAYREMMDEIWPKALAKLKELAEG